MSIVSRPREVRYLSTAETAKLIRKALKAAFPAVKFSVRSSSSVRVGWTDGPTTKRVEEVVSQFSSKSFDGSIDMEVSHTVWLCPDGDILPANCRGTVGSRGHIDAYSYPKPHDDAEEVMFGGYTFCTREVSDALWARVAQEVGAYWGVEVPARADAWRMHNVGNGCQDFGQLVWRASEDRTQCTREG